MFQKGFVAADTVVVLTILFFFAACAGAMVASLPSHDDMAKSVVLPLSTDQPKGSKSGQENTGKSTIDQKPRPDGQALAREITKDAPLYVHAECEHGCGYSEEGWWDRFWKVPNALFALWVAAFTFVLAGVSGWQGWMIRKQIALAREEFISTHRPKIVLRDVDLIGNEIYYMLVNIGGTEATIIESWIMLEALIADHPVRNLRSFGHDDIGRLKLAAGEIKDLTKSLDDEGGILIRFPNAARIEIEGKPKRSGEVHFAGAVLYQDSLGNRRRSVFRRRWHNGRKCFCRIDDPDLEYAD